MGSRFPYFLTLPAESFFAWIGECLRAQERAAAEVRRKNAQLAWRDGARQGDHFTKLNLTGAPEDFDLLGRVYEFFLGEFSAMQG